MLRTSGLQRERLRTFSESQHSARSDVAARGVLERMEGVIYAFDGIAAARRIRHDGHGATDQPGSLLCAVLPFRHARLAPASEEVFGEGTGADAVPVRDEVFRGKPEHAVDGVRLRGNERTIGLRNELEEPLPVQRGPERVACPFNWHASPMATFTTLGSVPPSARIQKGIASALP